MNEKYLTLFAKHKLYFAQCFGSKTSYMSKHKNDVVVFNARIYTKEYFDKNKNTKINDFFEGQVGEIWYGDINLSDIDTVNALISICKEIGPFIITREMGETVLIVDFDFIK